jgi:hypothetical protein
MIWGEFRVLMTTLHCFILLRPDSALVCTSTIAALPSFTVLCHWGAFPKGIALEESGEYRLCVLATTTFVAYHLVHYMKAILC